MVRPAAGLGEGLVSGRALIRTYAFEFLCSDTRSLAIKATEGKSFTSSIMNHNAGSKVRVSSPGPVSDISHHGDSSHRYHGYTP